MLILFEGFYGLLMHGGIDCWSRYLMWLKVWRTNRQGSLVAFWYLNSCWEYGNGEGIFDGTISDRGGENNLLARLQREMRLELVDNQTDEQIRNFQRVVQDSRLNQKSECYWSLFLRMIGNDILNRLTEACSKGLYNPRDVVQR
jgi:hypothetical protein